MNNFLILKIGGFRLVASCRTALECGLCAESLFQPGFIVFLPVGAYAKVSTRQTPRDIELAVRSIVTGCHDLRNLAVGGILLRLARITIHSLWFRGELAPCNERFLSSF